MDVIARSVVGIVGALQFIAIAFFAGGALLTDDSLHIARGVALLMMAPFGLITVPACVLAFRTRRQHIAAGLAVCSAVASLVLWQTM